MIRAFNSAIKYIKDLGHALALPVLAQTCHSRQDRVDVIQSMHLKGKNVLHNLPKD